MLQVFGKTFLFKTKITNVSAAFFQNPKNKPILKSAGKNRQLVAVSICEFLILVFSK
jgi:hypothetical protein